MDNVELKELMESWARQKVVCEQALATLANLEAKVKEEAGEHSLTVYSEHAVVYTKPGRRTWGWEQAVYDAHVPVERITPHSKIKTNFKKVCEAEGIKQENVSFTTGDPKIVVELAMSDVEKAEVLPTDNPSSNKMFK